MIDTNAIQQAGDVIQAAKAQWSVNGPALALGAALVAREIGRFNAWCVGVAEFVIRHGGIFMIARKLIWNPPAGGGAFKTEEIARRAIQTIPESKSELEKNP